MSNDMIEQQESQPLSRRQMAKTAVAVLASYRIRRSRDCRRAVPAWR